MGWLDVFRLQKLGMKYVQAEAAADAAAEDIQSEGDEDDEVQTTSVECLSVFWRLGNLRLYAVDMPAERIALVSSSGRRLEPEGTSCSPSRRTPPSAPPQSVSTLLEQLSA
jgi:hypothetical protein